MFFASNKGNNFIFSQIVKEIRNGIFSSVDNDDGYDDVRINIETQV